MLPHIQTSKFPPLLVSFQTLACRKFSPCSAYSRLTSNSNILLAIKSNSSTTLRRVIAHIERIFTVSFDGSWDFGAKQFPGKLLHQRNARASVNNVPSLRTCRTAIMTQCLVSRGRSFRLSGILLRLVEWSLMPIRYITGLWNYFDNANMAQHKNM